MPSHQNCLALLVATSAIVSACGEEIRLPAHPRLLVDSNGVAELKRRIAIAPWARTEWNKVQSAAGQALRMPVELPPRGGNWSHNYVCPTHGARLSTSAKVGAWEWEHRCPVGSHKLRGDPAKAQLDFDGNAISGEHRRWTREVVDHGLVFQMTGDARHAAKAREILLAYAERYLLYPFHDNQGRPGSGGRVASQSLTEATWLTEFVQGADLVWTTLSAQEQARVRDRVLLPAINDVLMTRKASIHNIQCHINSAIGLTGLLLGDQELIARAIDHPTAGYRQQLEKGVLADGMWYEGSSGYHFYTMEGLWPLAEAARHCGLDLYTPKFKSMFDAPLALAMPNLTLPDFNDSGMASLAGRAPVYELGLARFKNPLYVSLLGRDDRRNRMAMLFGSATLPGGQEVEPASRNFSDSGYAILQRGGREEAAWLCLKYGPHGGGHGHPDKNHFILFARGQVLAPDGGTHAYGSPLHKSWDQATAAHNTLVLNETSQKSAQGRSLAFGTARGVDYSVTDAGPIYPGVRFTRTVAMLSHDLIVFVDQVQAKELGTLDLNYHQVGKWISQPPGTAWSAPSAPGYRYLQDAAVRPLGPEGLKLTTSVRDGWQATILLAGGEPTEVITGHGILRTTEDRVPWLVQRRRAQATAFVWALVLNDAPVSLTVSDVQSSGGRKLDRSETLVVRVREGSRDWRLLVNPLKRKVVAAGEGGEWNSDAVFDVSAAHRGAN